MQVRDRRGRNVSASGSLGFTLDTVAPVAPGVALTKDTGASSADAITSDPSLTLTGVETALGTLVEYSVNGGPWTATAPTGLVEGSDTVQVRQTDVAGNVSAAGSLGFTFDTVAPAAPGVALANDTGTPGDLITSDPSLTLTGVETALGTLVEYSATAAPGRQQHQVLPT